jgi:hypothetical protein
MQIHFFLMLTPPDDFRFYLCTDPDLKETT